MKKFARSVLGVTLLEIMLVLAIAAMIIVMSVRYYQSATTNQQVNAALQMVQGIVSSADSLAQASGSYSAATQSSVFQLMGSSTGQMNTPWGTAVTVTENSGSVYTVTFPNTPAAVCLLLKARLEANKKFTNVSSCSTGASTFSYTYDATA